MAMDRVNTILKLLEGIESKTKITTKDLKNMKVDFRFKKNKSFIILFYFSLATLLLLRK